MEQLEPLVPLHFMRQCPNCGHRDNPLWENSRFEFNAEYMRFQEAEQQFELEEICLVLVDAPNHEPFMHNGVIYYRRGKNGIELYRQNPEDFRVPRERKSHKVIE
jgi:hypothetical protein